MKAGLIIVVVALMGAILAGSISFTHTTYPDIGYDKVSDLTPIVTADPVLSDEIYNPTSNQTGWSNVDYDTQTTPSVFSFRSNGTYTTFTTNTFASYGGAYYTTDATWFDGHTPRLSWSTGANGAYQTDNMIGGYHDKTQIYPVDGTGEYYSECIVKFNSRTATDTVPVYWQKLNTIASANLWPSGVIVDAQIPGGADQVPRVYQEYSYQGISFSTDSQNNGHILIATLQLTSGTLTDDQLYWNLETAMFYPITGTDELTGAPIYDTTQPRTLYWVPYGGNSITPPPTDSTLTFDRYVPGDVTYVTPYSAVSINPGNTATWSNGYSNTQVQLIVDRGASVNAAGVGLGIGSTIPYEKVLLTLGGDGAYYQGLSNYVSPTSYTINPYKYVLTTAPLTPITELIVSGSSMAYIANTWVPIDPKGLLWQDPEFNINTYFPTVVSSGARVIFSSILTTGDSITINGNTYNTYNGTVEIDGNTYRLNGLSVDYRTDGNVYIVTASGITIELGPRVTYEISADGVWYWSAELDDIHTEYRERTEILTAQAPDPKWMVFAFIGIAIICLVAMAAIGRESMDGFDWIIVILPIIISLMLVV